MHRIELQAKGFRVHFTQALASETRPEEIRKVLRLQSFHYDYGPKYGSPKRELKAVEVEQVKLSENRQSVYIEVPHLQARKIYQFKFSGMKSKGGLSLRNDRAYYTLNHLVK